MFKLYVAVYSRYLDSKTAPAFRGEFASWEKAVKAAEQIVDQSLTELMGPGMNEELFRMYSTFG